MAVSGGTKSWSRLESGKMPAWKLEVLERKRQKMASSAGVQSSRGKDVSPSRHSRKGSPERLVLQDSLGPLNENPFIKLENELRRRRPQQHHHLSSTGRAASPIRHLLDMYSNVPGIRTIRAENIIIIESDPGYFSQPSHIAGADPVEELLAKRGSKVAEIRASEVIIYEPEPPGKEPIKKKQQSAPKKELLEHNKVVEEAGRVSRLMEKFDHGHSKPLRSRSLEDLLERDQKPALLPKPASAERQGHVPQSKAPKRSGETSPSSASILEEDGKRFPLNNPSWLPSKPPAVHSLPDPGLFHKRPPSPGTPPAFVFHGSLPSVAPLSPRYEMASDEKLVSPTVATVREKFEVGYPNNQQLSKFMNVAQKTGSNTIFVNPKAAPVSKARPSDATVGATVKSSSPLTNGHVDHSEMNANTNSSIKIQDLLSKSKRTRGTATRRSSEGSGVVPSPVYNSTNELPKGANEWRPKSEVKQPKTSIPSLSSASHSESSFHNHCDTSFSSATPSQLMKVSSSTSSNDSFEIRPAEKPDLSKIAEDDIQAKALANIRMQSKNSFVFVPKKRQDPPAPATGSTVLVPTKDKPKVQVSASTRNGPKLDSTDSTGENSVKLKEVLVPVKRNEKIEQTSSSVTFKSSEPLLLDFDWKSGLLPSKSTEGHSFTDVGAELEYLSSVHQGDAMGILTVPVTKIHEDVPKPDIPVTNIDDIVNIDDRELSKEAKSASKVTPDPSGSYRPHASLSSVRAKGTNTFTVIPKRKPITENEAFRTPVADEDDDEETGSKRKSSDGYEAPYSEIGALLKKRYPTAEEIKVVGGYQSLSKSCLSKIGSTRKKMKISFNEQNIHTMFEYPSESSLVEEVPEEEGNYASGSESEEEDKPSGLFIPRVTFGSSGTTSNGLQAKSNSGLSNYTPKHSVEYSKWQDEKTQVRPASLDGGDHEGMLTPDYGDSHSDFRSEPALYF
ncbi:PREDICTED: taperin [Nanorana parkeri]|uniref:taperin n=1 Tax=Nanorana parkeri TaxID=125878 RepID=UPI000854C720|nr:PREDICTED: taperin [Nanorana parkeri]